jgi:prevent-host-death family protein
MVEIGIKELRSDLSNHVKRAANGETVVVTVGGKPMAKLSPIATGTIGMTMEDAYASGRIIRAPRRGQTPPPPPSREEMLNLDRPASAMIDELREEKI